MFNPWRTKILPRWAFQYDPRIQKARLRQRPLLLILRSRRATRRLATGPSPLSQFRGSGKRRPGQLAPSASLFGIENVDGAGDGLFERLGSRPTTTTTGLGRLRRPDEQVLDDLANRRSLFPREFELIDDFRLIEREHPLDLKGDLAQPRPLGTR